MAINYEQGLGFSENTGYWPMPETRTGVISITDELDYVHVLVLDYSDGKFYDVYNRNGAAGSGIVRETKDKVSVDGTGGYDITPEVTFKEDTGEFEKYISEILSNRFYLRPYDEDNRDETGYDSSGFLDGIEFTASIYADGEPTTETAYAKDISKNGEVLYDTKAEGHRMQTKLSANKTDFQLVGRQQDYITKNINYDIENRSTTENTLQLDISSPVVWVTRGENKDLISGTSITVDGNTTGPDSRSNSAITVTTPLSITGIPAGSKDIVMFVDGTYAVDIDSSTISFTEHDSSGDWSLLYATGVTETGTLTITPTGTVKVFDIRVFDSAKSSADRDYIFKDVTRNGADNICPLF